MHRFRRLCLASATASMLALAPSGQIQAADGLSGAYLAARQAMQTHDFSAAAEYFATVAERDPGNLFLMEMGLMVQVARGDIAAGIALATNMAEQGHASQAGNLVLLADAFAQRDYAAVHAAADGDRSAGPMVDGLLRAWAYLGAGSMSEALDTFDNLAGEPGAEMFSSFHKALALAHVGDFETAATLFEGDGNGPLRLTRRGIVAHLQVLGQLERFDDAIALARNIFGHDPEPDIAALVRQFEEGNAPPFDIITGPRDGAAEVFHTLASVLSGEPNETFALHYARLAEHLSPDHADAHLLIAGLMEGFEQYELAIESYGRIPADNPFHLQARLGRAQALYNAGETERALNELDELTGSYSSSVLVHNTLGDLLRREERFDEASRAYTAAIDLIATPEERHWVVFYTRGITHEREGRWEQAEADFRKALTLRPEQPHVLNYLGYSLVERREKLDEALDMIERAVEGEPESGYITDSLGWVLYRLGRYEEAVPHMERAVELEPSDAVINDHLGDVYWAVGRELEARFQWRRALSFGPADDLDMERVRRKLDVGLDQVLIEEGAEPHHPVQSHGN